MAKSNKRAFSIFGSLLVLLIGMVLFSAASQNNSNQDKPKKDLAKRLQQMDARIPSTDYDSPEPTNVEEKAKRTKKNKHYDRWQIVMKNPSDEGTATVIDSHDFFALPALPLAQSDVVLIADVHSSEAHLSNTKRGVYSEFGVQVSEVLKGTADAKRMTISRPGGKVRYASGHVERYEIMNQHMPAIGRRYLFFLKAIPDTKDYEILTAYDVGSERVQPLDTGQFEAFRGNDVVQFINTVRDAVAKN